MTIYYDFLRSFSYCQFNEICFVDNLVKYNLFEQHGVVYLISVNDVKIKLVTMVLSMCKGADMNV